MLLRNVSFVRKLQTFSDYQLKTSVIIELYIKRTETNRDRESLLHFLFHLRIRLIKTYGDFFYTELQLAVKITPTWQSMPTGLLWKVMLVWTSGLEAYVYLPSRSSIGLSGHQRTPRRNSCCYQGHLFAILPVTKQWQKISRAKWKIRHLNFYKQKLFSHSEVINKLDRDYSFWQVDHP